MDSFSSSSPFPSPYSLSSDLSFSPTISNDDFNLFHSIDRRLFSTLVHNLRINPAESMQVMAFLIWLERSGLSINTVKKLLEWPWNLIHQLADQILFVLRCAENEKFSWQKRGDIPLLQKLCQRHVNLLQFHENRIEVLRGVSKVVNEVCVRAFKDLVQSNFVESNQNGSNHRPIVPPPFEYSRFGGNVNFSQQNLPRREVSQVELTQILSGMNLGDHVSEEEGAVPPDERTIFLTFSKGYPISEFEVRDFFTRIYGNFIESIYMQEVPEGEQPLYARMIAKSATRITAIARVDARTKYIINGKHVWARKFVRKNHANATNSPPSSPVEDAET